MAMACRIEAEIDAKRGQNQILSTYVQLYFSEV